LPQEGKEPEEMLSRSEPQGYFLEGKELLSLRSRSRLQLQLPEISQLLRTVETARAAASKPRRVRQERMAGVASAKETERRYPDGDLRLVAGPSARIVMPTASFGSSEGNEMLLLRRAGVISERLAGTAGTTDLRDANEALELLHAAMLPLTLTEFLETALSQDSLGLNDVRSSDTNDALVLVGTLRLNDTLVLVGTGSKLHTGEVFRRLNPVGMASHAGFLAVLGIFTCTA